MTIDTILITNDPLLAAEAEAAGVTRIMVDLESIGKQERQASRRTFISSHTVEDIAPVRAALKKAMLIVRINPWYVDSPAEIAQAVKGGADAVMLPFVTQLHQLDAFLDELAGRAQPLPLVETAYSMAHLDAIAANPAINEIYIGLNDLHLSLGLDFLFEPLALGLVDWMAERIKAQGKAFGFGGITAIGHGDLPAEYILAEHACLGSSCVILSARFWKDIQLDEREGRPQRLKDALTALQSTWNGLQHRSAAQAEEESRRTSALIKTLAANGKTSGKMP